MSERTRGLLRDARVQAEVLAAAWELFSALLFISAVVPAGFSTAWPGVIFLGSMILSAAIGPIFLAKSARAFARAGAVRMVAWPLAVAPLVGLTGPRVLVAAFAFGLMAGGMRSAIYRRMVAADRRADGSTEAPTAAELGSSLRARLGESAMMAGILGGHVMMLFSVAFLRTQSQLLYEAWFEIVPALGVLGTLGFTLAVRPLTSATIAALGAGESGEPALLQKGLRQAIRVADLLSYLNFGVWLACTTIGVFWIRPGPRAWNAGDALMQLGFGGLFAWGVSFYQRAWHRDTLEPVVERLRRWTGEDASAELITLRRRMLRDFGLPLLFTATLSLFSSIGLYRALGTGLPLREDFNAVSALFASFAMLVLAVGGVVARAAHELSRPMAQLASAADRVARGRLEASVPRLSGPIEVVGLGESVERMREGLARTIAELEREREGLEANVETRTAELRRALEELKNAQAALVHGERMASIGELVSGVAHEIYNPLNAIAGAVTPLERLVDELRSLLGSYRAAEEDLPPERRRSLEALRRAIDLDASLDDLVGISTVVRRATERSVRIVTNLKNFSRASGESVPTDLRAGIDETLMLLAPRMRQACIQVTKRYGDLPQVVCRPGEMNQVFMNLLTNALQALEQKKGGGEREIGIETRAEGGMAVVVVEDNGPGVPEHLGSRIFDPFFTTKPRGEGTGLGLSISTDIARRHGGTLIFERQPVGARFVCRIPLNPRSGVHKDLSDRPEVGSRPDARTSDPSPVATPQRA